MYKKSKIIMALLLVAALGFGSFFVLPALARAIGDGLPALSQALAAGKFDFGDGADENEGAIDEVALDDGALDEDVDDEASTTADMVTEATAAAEDLAPFAPMLPAADFNAYTIVDPGNGENGVDVLTWEQIYNGASGYDWRINTGDIVNIQATSGPANGAIRINFYYENQGNGAIAASTVMGVPGVIYDNLAIATIGDTIFNDISAKVDFRFFANTLTLSGNAYSDSQKMSLTVIGDCFFETYFSGNGQTSYCMRMRDFRAIKQFEINGTGSLTLRGFNGLDFNIYDRNVDLIITVNTHVTTIGAYALYFAAPSDTTLEINGSGNLEIIGDGMSSSTAYARAIYVNNTSIKFSGDLKLYAKGSGTAGGLNMYIGGDSRTMVFDLTNDIVFEGGDNGSGALFASVSTGGEIIIENNGTGDVIFCGGTIYGNGLQISTPLSIINNNSGNFIMRGVGYGSGIYVSGYGTAGNILDISKSNSDLVAMGGETAQGSGSAQIPAGLYLEDGYLTINLGNNNILFQGGPNGGPGIMAYSNDSNVNRQTMLNVVSTGGEIYALGGKGLNGYGIYSTRIRPFYLSGNGIINAYGSYQQPGILMSTVYQNLMFSGSLTMNAIGGENAQGIVMQNANNRIEFSDNSPTLAITNNSAVAEAHPFVAVSGGMWDLTDATLAAGAPGDANVTISVAPGVTGTIRR